MRRLRTAQEWFGQLCDRGAATDHWPWRGHRCRGVCRIYVGKDTLGAARVGYEMEFGPVPPGKKVVNTCGDKGCVNPYHHALERCGPQRRLSLLELRAISERIERGEPKVTIAREYGVARATVLRWHAIVVSRRKVAA